MLNETGGIDGQYNEERFLNQTKGIFDMDDELLLNEQIKMVAVFGEGLNPCRPVKFRRANCREVVITEIGLRHPCLKGKRMMHVFDVTDGQADYRIEFDAERLTWTLTREADHQDA